MEWAHVHHRRSGPAEERRVWTSCAHGKEQRLDIMQNDVFGKEMRLDTMQNGVFGKEMRLDQVRLAAERQ